VIDRRPAAGLALACALVLGACPAPEEPARAPDASVGTGEFGDAAQGLGPLDALGRRFGRVRTRLRDLGLDRELGYRRVFLPEGGGTELPLDLDTDDCATLVALGGSGLRDLRMVLYDGDGREVAEDGIPGEGGLVHVCPQAGPADRLARPYHLVLLSREGSGAVALGGLVGRPDPERGFEGVFDGVLSPRVPVEAVAARLARSLPPLRARGLEPVGEAEYETLAEGGVLRRSVRLERSRCYVILARGDREIADLDLILFDPSGAEIARDLEGDAEPRLEHCPAETGRHTIELRPYEGAGALGWMLLVGPGREPAGSAGEGTPAAAGADEAAAPVERPDPVAALGAAAAGLASRGYDPPLFLVRGGFLAPGESRGHEIVLGPGCTVVLGTAADPGVDLDLYLAREDGEVVDVDTRVQPMARVAACPARSRLFRVTVKSYGREGTYALATLHPPEDVDDMLDLRLEDAASGVRSRGFVEVGRRRPPAVGGRERVLGEGARWTEPVRPSPGRCLAFVAAGDEGVTDLDLLVRDASGTVLASDAGPAPFAGVVRCAPLALDPEALYEVEVVVYRGRGRVRRLLLAQPAPIAPPSSPGAAAPVSDDRPASDDAASGDAASNDPASHDPASDDDDDDDDDHRGAAP
jgi:hypothetical protein